MFIDKLALTLAIAMSAKYLRQVRATVLEELGKAVPHAMPREALLEALTPMWKGN